MVALGLLLQAAAAASPLETARLHLARGDTAPAVTELLPLAAVGDTVTTDELTALVLLQRIGRSDSQQRAREAWLAAGATLNLILTHGPAAGVLLGAVVVDEAEVVVDDELRGQVGALSWTTWASSLATGCGKPMRPSPVRQRGFWSSGTSWTCALPLIVCRWRTPSPRNAAPGSTPESSPSGA